MAMSETEAIEGEFVQEIAYIVPDVETTCSICHAEFLDHEDLNIHVKQVHEGSAAYRNICQFCDKTYADLDVYACHIRDVHFFQLICCCYCTKCFVSTRAARKHEGKHRRSDMYACSQCAGVFTTKKELKLHEFVNHNNTFDGVFLRCMPHLSAVLKHKVINVLQSQDKVMTCQSCGFSSSNAYSYIQHTKNDTCTVCVCDKCSNVYKNKKNLQKHFRSKNRCLDPAEYVNNLIKCPTCMNDVHREQMQKHHKYCKVYKCEICDIKFDTINDLSNHQYEAHPSDLEVIKCDYCTKEYVGQAAVDKHVERSHRHLFILYKYACKEKDCRAIFKHPQKLFAHYFTKHKDLEPYTCRICDKKFRIRKNFTIHIKLEHKGTGVVEFDEQYHVFFAEKKSEFPFIPTCVVPELVPNEDMVNSKQGRTKSEKKRKSGRVKRPKGQDSEVENFNDLTTTANDTATEIEPDENESLKKETSTLKSKTKNLKRRKKDSTVSLSSSDEDETKPLIKLMKKAERKRFQKLLTPSSKKEKPNSINRKPFTCKVCDKYCYTYQNYHNHIKIHSKHESIECVKCSRSFKNKKELAEHVSTDHATSKLIETLKNVLERKQGETQNASKTVSDTSHLTLSERFMRTLVRVKIDKSNTPAKIGPPKNASVRNFLENFIPDVNEPKEVIFDPVVTIKHYDSPFYRTRSIKLTKYTPENHTSFEKVKLKMPEKFKSENNERVKLNVKLVQQPLKQSIFEYNEAASNDDDVNNDNFQEFDDYEEYKHDSIPEVAQEVMLEISEEPPVEKVRPTPHKVRIPKIPNGYPHLHIATLQPQAPFYKIIKVKEINSEQTIISAPIDEKEPEPAKIDDKDDIIRLPDGTTFVTANPLAHLLGNKPVEEVVEPLKNKHYTPAKTDYKGLLASAMQNLEKKRNAITNKQRKIKRVNALQMKHQTDDSSTANDSSSK